MKISYFSSTKIACPICSEELQREELHVGRGRIVVDSMTEELRHTYKPSEKYGIVNPLLYPITVCTNCYYSTFKNDFLRINEQEISAINKTQIKRKTALVNIFPQLNFHKNRSLPEGIASYYYAMQCYECFGKEHAPTFKQGLCALRAAWIVSDLHTIKSDEKWDSFARIFYRKARYLYKLSLEYEQKQEEVLPSDFNLGPDTEVNYGFDGILYLVSLLELRWGPRADGDIRQKNLIAVRTQLSKIFGSGKASQLKPAAIIDNAQRIHGLVNQELKTL